MNHALFDLNPADHTPRKTLSADQRRTARQAAHLAHGVHPLTAALGQHIPLHPDAAPATDRTAPGRRCGGCRFRQVVRWHTRTYAKCTHGDGARATHGAGTDIRAWWPACTDHEHGDPALGTDAARYVPEPSPEGRR